MSGQYRNISISDTSGVYTNINVTTSPVELKVGASALTGRDTLVIQPKGNSIYIGFNSSVSSSNGIQIFKDQILTIEASDSIQVFAVSSSGTIDVRISELS